MTVTQEQVEAGQAVYTRQTLSSYDSVVLGFSNRFLWRCPTRYLLEHYNQNISANHLDVGVGTGYFLDRCRFPIPEPRIALMDLNPESIAFCAERIERYRPETYRHNILEPITSQVAAFDSVGINYLLHCLPGTLATKAVVFDHLKAKLNPGAVLFGSTILQGGVSRNFLARRLMDFYNQQGIFSNQNDDLSELDKLLHDRFREVTLRVIGCVALFSGRE